MKSFQLPDTRQSVQWTQPFPQMRLEMPGRSLMGWYGSLAAFMILGLVFMNLPNYLNAIKDSLLPKYFYYLFFAMLGPMVLMRPRAAFAYLFSPFGIWALLVLALNLIHYLSAPGDTSALKLKDTTDMIGSRMLQVIMAASIGYGLSNIRTESYAAVFRILVVVIPIVLVFDFLKPGVFYPLGTGGSVWGRSAATFINPNIAGESLLIAFLLACPSIKRSYRLPLLLLVGMGLMLTFTRAAIIAWALLWIYLAMINVVSRRASALVFIGLLLAMPVFLAGFEAYLGGRQDLADISNLQQRLGFFSSASLNDFSAQERAEVLARGWNMFLENPFLGAGGGATKTWPFGVSTHNQFVLLAAEYGVLGIVVWIFLGIILWRGRYFRDRRLQHVLCFFYLYMTFFTHNMIDSAYWLVTFALVSGRFKA